MLRQEPDLLAARPLVASAVAGVIGGDAFASLFRRGVRDVHRAVFHADRNTVTLTLVDVGIVASEAARRLAPAQAAQLEDASGRVELLRRDVGGATGEVARRARQLRVLAIVLAVLLLAVAAAAIALAADKRRDRGGARQGDDRRRACSSCAPTWWPGRSRSTGSPIRSTGQRRAAYGTRSSATCARRAGCSPAAAPSSPRRRRR